jgi:acetyltransferase-like isoleucine patch superfamily enzyme
MIHFRIRDLLSVLLYRLLSPFFGAFGRKVRLVSPLRIYGARYCRFGDDVAIQTGAYIAVLPPPGETARLEIGNGSKIGNFAHLVVRKRVTIGRKVLTADRLFVSDNIHEYDDPDVPVMDQGLRQLAEVSIGDGSWIGENVCIIGCSIGQNCIVAANSVVTRDVPDRCVAAGAPARIVRRYCADAKAWRPTDAAGNFQPDDAAPRDEGVS